MKTKKKTTKFLTNDPFEPTDDSVYLEYRSEMEEKLKDPKNLTCSFVIEQLKGMCSYYRWDVFCWLIQNYPFHDEEVRSMFKFSWLFSAPDVRATELLRYYIDNRLLMTEPEQKELDNLPSEVTIYKAVSLRDMEVSDDEEWEPGFDWKWSLDLGKVAFIAHSLSDDCIVISTKVEKSEIRALFHGVDATYELIAEGNCKERDEYRVETYYPTEYLESHPYLHEPITEDSIYQHCGF